MPNNTVSILKEVCELIIFIIFMDVDGNVTVISYFTTAVACAQMEMSRFELSL